MSIIYFILVFDCDGWIAMGDYSSAGGAPAPPAAFFGTFFGARGAAAPPAGVAFFGVSGAGAGAEAEGAGASWATAAA